ncbi:MAG: 16S rRNA (cytidine(1402)-2'-O)-methyltransferase [Holosporales bacterium]|jgi:16S rRNA (cytidine1402-2'-O)-methyltransferase|nr:16S rRNA (cytidine(1402)-2'-O)-methyltransferase [Holosporales bacterium]
MTDYSLYIVATPIGNLKDISQRAVETLEIVDCILCEDTRVSEKLLRAIGISGKKLIVYNDYTASKIIDRIIHGIISEKLKFALISDAGMPLISDPGYKLIQSCIENKVSYTVVPGASSVLSALVLSGMPSNNFMFCGFVNPRKLEVLSKANTTLVMFESTSRIAKTISQIAKFFDNRKIAIVREITKIHEEVIIGKASELIERLAENPIRGEAVIVIEPPIDINSDNTLSEHKDLIMDLRERISDSELSTIISKHLKISRNSVYNFIKSCL